MPDRGAGVSVAILLEGCGAGGVNASGNATVTVVPSSTLLCTVDLAGMQRRPGF